MSNQTDDSGARPQVIDLEAEEIGNATSSATADGGTHNDGLRDTPPRTPSRGASGWIIAALVLGLIGGGWLYRGVLSRYLPSNEMTMLSRQVAALEQNNSDLSARLAEVKQAADGAAAAAAPAGDVAAQAAQAATSATAQIGDISTKLGAADQQSAALGEQLATVRSDLDQLRKSISSATASGTAASPADAAVLAALGQRIDALEKDMASLKAGAGTGSKASATAALSQALSDLKAKVAAGTGFAPEYERIARMVPAAPGLDVVASAATEGVPDAKQLAAQLRAAIPALPQPEAVAAEDDSYLGTVMKSLSGIITIRPIGTTDWRQQAEKAAAFAEAGDLTQAIGVIDAAEGERPMALAQWSARAQSRLRLEAAVSQLSEAVLRQIAADGGAAQ